MKKTMTVLSLVVLMLYPGICLTSSEAARKDTVDGQIVTFLKVGKFARGKSNKTQTHQ